MAPWGPAGLGVSPGNKPQDQGLGVMGDTRGMGGGCTMGESALGLDQAPELLLGHANINCSITGSVAVPWEIIAMLGKGIFCPQKGFLLQKEHTDGETEAGLTLWHPSPPSAAG